MVESRLPCRRLALEGGGGILGLNWHHLLIRKVEADEKNRARAPHAGLSEAAVRGANRAQSR